MSKMLISKLQLLKAAAEWTSIQFLKTGMDKQFSEGEPNHVLMGLI
jgi:hypothetical protein